MKNENKTVRNIIVGMFFLLGFLFAINPVSRGSLSLFLFFLIIEFIVYTIKDYQSELIGISTKTIGRSLLIGTGMGLFFYLVTKLVPGFSLGLPLLPNAISDSLKFFIIVFVAPIVEEIFFRGAMLGYLKDVTKTRNIIIIILIQAIAFSLFHLGAYITGFYTLPSISSGILAFSSNISAFISAFAFGTIAGIIAVKTKSLLTTIIFHLIVNFVIYTAFAILILN